MSTATAQVQPTTTTASEFMSILIDDNKRSNAVSVGTDGVKLMDNGVSTVTGAVSSSIEGIPISTSYPLDSEYSAIVTQFIDLVTAQLESPKIEMITSHGRTYRLFSSKSYTPLTIERIYEVLRSQGVYRTLDGLFVCENNYVDAEIRWKISRFIDGIIEQYIRTSLDNTPLNSGDGKEISKDDINSSEIYRVFGALLKYESLNNVQWRIIQVLGTLGYHLINKDTLLDCHLFTETLLYHGYFIALCTTDVIEKLNDVTRQKSAHMILLRIFTLYSDLVQVFLNIHNFSSILPVTYHKCFKVDNRTKTLPGNVDFYKRNGNLQSDNESSVKNPHIVGHWTIVTNDSYKLTFISNMCVGCDACNRSEHPINSSDPDYRKMLSLVPERGVFKLYTDWRLLVLYATLIGTLIPTLYAIYKLRQDGIDPGGLTGTIVLIAIASVGFVRELFYPETELRDFLRAKVAVSKFSKYCKQKGVCGSCVAALAVKNRADFGPVAVGPYASIAGGKPGPPERGKVFMDEPCDIKCFYAAGFALTPSAQFVSNNISLPLMDGDTKIVEMELPPVFKQLIAYRGNNHFDTISAADYFIVGMSDKYDHNVPTLTLGVATIRNDQIIRVEWLPVPTNAFVGYSSFNLSTLKHYVQ